MIGDIDGNYDMPDGPKTLRDVDTRRGLRDWLKTSEARSFLLAVGVLAALTLVMFGDVLFAGHAVLGRQKEDLVEFFIPWRQFGFSELRAGNLALWNPYIFSGAPYMGGFESALLYPGNVLYLLLPLAAAINWTIAVHLFGGGVFMYLWAQHRGMHPAARLLTAVLFMFCGAHFLRLQAGHLGNLAAMIWAPLIFLSIDGFFRSRSGGWCLLGAFAVCMQIMSGHPQYVFFTAVAAAIYTGLCLVRSRGRGWAVLAFSGIYFGAAALSAVQLLTGLDAVAGGARSGGTDYWFAGSYSFPPENLITLVVPGFFGNVTQMEYWGRWDWCEVTLFVGITGLVLAIYGALFARREARRFSAVMVVVCLLLALGKYTPLFPFLYEHVPGFNRFRSMSRFALHASLFIIMLAGLGLDALLLRRRACGKAALAAAAGGAIVGVAGLAVRASALAGSPDGLWRRITEGIHGTMEWGQAAVFLGTDVFQNAAFLREAGLFAATGLFVAAGTLAVAAALLVSVKFSRKFVFAVALLAAVEVFTFARISRPRMEYRPPALRLENVYPGVRKIEALLAGYEGDYRILNLVCPNSGMSTRRREIWGGDSFVRKRYAEFMAFTQGQNPDEATEVPPNPVWTTHPLYKMLRLRFITNISDDGKLHVEELPDPMGRLELIRQCRVIEGRDEIFAAMGADDFDPRETVILETRPDPWPQRFGRGGSARIVDCSTDHLTIEADVPAPAILLITDTYAAGWRAVALPGSVQQDYQLLPANYVLRAVPLAAGKHRLRVEYSPPAFRVGVWISIASLAAYLALLAWYVWRRARRGAEPGRASRPAAVV